MLLDPQRCRSFSRSVLCPLLALAGALHTPWALCVPQQVYEDAAWRLVHAWQRPALRIAIESQLARTTDAPLLAQVLGGSAAKSERSSEAGTTVQWRAGSQAGQAPRYVAWPPLGDDLAAPGVPAIELANGRRVWLDAITPPLEPVLLLGADEDGAGFVSRSNAALAAAGLQRHLPPSLLDNVRQQWQKAAVTVATTRLDRISVRDDKEPWVSGNAEMYLLVSGVLAGNQPQVFLVDLPYLDQQAIEYYPRQIIVDWRQFGFQAVNVLLYEHDDNTSYQTLVQALIGVIGEIGSLAGYPEAVAIETIASAIVQAMPAHWFANADDFVDAVYTLEKSAGVNGRWGAGANVRVDYMPYTLSGN